MSPRSTARRLRHSAGYLGLGMIAEAARELDGIVDQDRLTPEVMSARVDLHMHAKQWDLVVAASRELAQLVPEDDKGWISWAFALRELNRVEEARTVLLGAEPRLGKKCGILHYNLACYHCLLGDRKEAKRRLALASAISAEWKNAARDDIDLTALWDDLTTTE